MKLSVIIVNYNVQYFLEQCLYSVQKAIRNISVEVFVVDNNSVDGSVAMVKSKFPEVNLIENKKNTGFSYANNQAIKISKGEYVLLLNPDTLVEEDTFEKVISFMDAHQDGGGLGVYMIDGSGNYLPESKRGLPTPKVAFNKIVGLSALFPKSEKFGKYHLGYLDKNKIHEVDVLSGAFMLLRRKTLDEIGLLDETFFMYGEDIDLSYRITKGGYKNYYFPDTRIIHYKGESTKKSSVNYVFVFYNAMIIFAKKHFSKKNVKTFSLLINFAIYLRAGIAVLNRFFTRIALPLFDASVIYGGLYFLKNYWENTVKLNEGLHFTLEVLTIAFPLYVLIWLTSVYYSGGYDKPIKYSKIIKGLAIGTGIILIIYALLSEEYRFSRAMIILGAVWATISTIGIRLFLSLLKIEGFEINSGKKKRILVVGGYDEFKRVAGVLSQSGVSQGFIAFANDSSGLENNEYLGKLENIQEIVNIYQIDEVIFCAKDISSQQIISLMAILGDSKAEFKIAPPESLYIIGSNSIESNGELYVININSINKFSNKRSKRLFDIVLAFCLLIVSPVLIFLIKKPFHLFRNIFLVLMGNKSWVGYCLTDSCVSQDLPEIRKGVLTPSDSFFGKISDNRNVSKINHLYAKDYRIYNDVIILLRGYKYLGRK